VLILLSGEVILLYSYYAKEGLVYITITALSSRQLSSCSECTSVNIRSSYDICSVSDTKYIFYIRYCLYSPLSSGSIWCYAALLALFYTF